MNNLDGLFNLDIDDRKRRELLKELAKLTSTYSKIKFVYDHVGPDYLLRYGAQDINEEFYEMVSSDPDAYESITNYIVNLFVRDQKREFFNARKEEFSKRAEECLNLRELKLLIQEEIKAIQVRVAQCEDSEESADKSWLEGYRSEARKLIIPVYPATYENCYNTTNGCAECIFELELQRQLEEVEEAGNIQEDKERYPLGTQYEIILYFIYSGILDTLTQQLGENKSKIARAICTITGAKSPASIRQLLVHLTYGYKDPRNRKLYQEVYVSKTIETLKATGLDASKLEEIYEDLP